MIQTKIVGPRVLRWITEEENNTEEMAVNVRTANKIINDMKQGEYGIAIEKGEAKFYRQEKFLKLLLLANQIGATPELMKMMIETFDELDAQEKATLTRSIDTATLSEQAGIMEQEIRQQADSRRGLVQKDKEVETKRIAAQAKQQQKQAA